MYRRLLLAATALPLAADIGCSPLAPLAYNHEEGMALFKTFMLTVLTGWVQVLVQMILGDGQTTLF